MSKLNHLENDLNSMILGGQALEAFEKYYADDVVMQEKTAKIRASARTATASTKSNSSAPSRSFTVLSFEPAQSVMA